MHVAFAEAAQECCVPADFATKVLCNFTVATFARVASSAEACETVFQELLVEGHFDAGPASERIQAMASLRPRLLLKTCRSAEQLSPWRPLFLQNQLQGQLPPRATLPQAWDGTKHGRPS